MPVTTVIPCASTFMASNFHITHFSQLALFTYPSVPLLCIKFCNERTKMLPWHHIKRQGMNHSNMKSISFLHDSNTNKKSIVNYDDGWEEEWYETEQEDSMMLVLFSSDIMKGD